MQHIISPEAYTHLAHDYEGTCITIGNFDGLHKGHQGLVRRTFDKARHHNLLPTVVTFWPHPLTVLAGTRAPALLISQEERARLLGQFGVELVLELPFTRQLAELNPEEFVQEVLCPLQCRQLVIGYDFSLGKKRAGNYEVLQELGTKYGFGVEQVAPVIVLDAVVSSTRIRELVRRGEVWESQELLGRYYSMEGKVIHGYGRGGGFGYPTANVDHGGHVLLQHGVYATWVSGATEKPLMAVTNVGVVPTFGNNAVSVESFILDEDINLYEKRVRLSFVQFIRPEQRFENVTELKERIAKDVTLARGVLQTSKPL